MIRMAIGIAVAVLATSAHAETFNYICKDHGSSLPLKVDDAKNLLDWKGNIYRIQENENCAKFGWRAERDGASFDFCTATQGYADFQQNGATIRCELKRR
jgi:hypothetical protein